MGFKVAKVQNVKRIVKVLVPIDGKEFREESISVGMNFFNARDEEAKKKAHVDAKSVDVDFDFLLKDVVTSIEGPEYEDGTAMSIEDALLWGPIRTAIANEYTFTANGIRRKN
jgi:hypothetical protein